MGDTDREREREREGRGRGATSYRGETGAKREGCGVTGVALRAKWRVLTVDYHNKAFDRKRPRAP